MSQGHALRRHGPVPVVVDDAEEPERLGRFVAQLVGLQGPDAGDVHRRQGLAPASPEPAHPGRAPRSRCGCAGASPGWSTRPARSRSSAGRSGIAHANFPTSSTRRTPLKARASSILRASLYAELGRPLHSNPGTVLQHSRRLRTRRRLAQAAPAAPGARPNRGADDVEERAGARLRGRPRVR